MLQCLTAIPLHLSEIFQYSGRYFYQIGQYHECIDNEKMTYNLVTFKEVNQNIDLGTMIGLCLPRQCTIDSVKEIVNQLLIQIDMPFEVSSINNKVPDYQYGYSWLFWITILISLITLFLVIFASIFPKKIHKLSMFSIQQSRKLFKHHPNSSLNVLNGVRSISMIWVVLGHALSFTISGSINITSSLEKNTLLTPFFLFIQAGMFAVDIFFYVGGLLLAYVFIKQVQGNKSIFAYPLALIQRLLRFWPSYIMAMLIFYTIYLNLGSGPRWGSDEETVKFCGSMWRAIFFVDNLVNNGETQCMGWGWYLQNDMQLFIISLGFLFLYSIKPWISKSTIIASIIGSCIFTYIWAFDHKTTVITHLSDFADWGDFVTNVYMKPWSRAPPYLYGLFVGLWFVEYWLVDKDKKETQERQTFLGKCSLKFKQNRKLRIFTQWSGIVIILFIILIPRTLQTGIEWPQYAHALYESLAKVFFVIALTLTILPSLLDNLDSIIFFTMDTRSFNFIGKISFCTYLIHLTILQVWVQSRTYDRYYTIIPVFVQFCGVLVLSLLSGLIMTLTIQMPFSKLQKKLISFIKSSLKISSAKQASQKRQSRKQADQALLKQSLLSQN